MKKAFTGKSIALGGTRKIAEFTSLIENHGGVAISRPLQGTTFFNELQISDDIVNYIKNDFDWSIFTTGIGITTLLESAEKICLSQQFIEKIKSTNVAARGYKTYAALKKLEVSPIVRDDDGTNRSLINNLQSFDLSRKNVMVQLHGESAPKLIQFLEQNGANVMQILPYKHTEPDENTVDKLCNEILEGKVDAVCFTTMIQVQNLFRYAKKKGIVNEMKERFHHNVVATSVGKVTTERLMDEGITRIVAPEHERMGAMIIELVKYYNNHQ